jgi:hypothetical protein
VKDTVKLPQKRPKEGVTAWGKEVGGLQAGLGYLPGRHRTYHTGETVTLVVRVRNVSKEAVKFQYIPKFFVETPPTVTDGDGKQVHFRYGFIELTRSHSKVEVKLAPGKEIKLGEVKLLTTHLGRAGPPPGGGDRVEIAWPGCPHRVLGVCEVPVRRSAR